MFFFDLLKLFFFRLEAFREHKPANRVQTQIRSHAIPDSLQFPIFHKVQLKSIHDPLSVKVKALVDSF